MLYWLGLTGEFVLIHGGAGGTGHVAAQLAVLRRARAAITASSQEKADIAVGLGAEFAINCRETDFAQSMLSWL
jgi:NADPH2:quinone reductase